MGEKRERESEGEGGGGARDCVLFNIEILIENNVHVVLTACHVSFIGQVTVKALSSDHNDVCTRSDKWSSEINIQISAHRAEIQTPQ